MGERNILLITDRTVHISAYRYERRQWVAISERDYSIEAPITALDEGQLGDYGRELGLKLAADHADGLTCRVIIPSIWCFSQCLDVPVSASGGDAPALALEQFLPCNLETLTWTAEKLASNRFHVIAVNTVALGRFLASLQEQGIVVEVLYVDYCVAASSLLRQADSHSGLRIISDTYTTTVDFDQNSHSIHVTRIIRTMSDGSTSAKDRSQSRLLISDNSAKFKAFSLTGTPLGEGIAGIPPQELTPYAQTVRGLLDEAASQDFILNLRTRELSYQGRWNKTLRLGQQLLVTLTLLLVCLGGTLRWQNSRIRSETAELIPLRNEAFGRVFQNATVPNSAALLVASERVKLEGLTAKTASGNDELRDLRTDPLQTLKQLTEQIPAAMKLNVEEIILDRATVSISGKTTSHDAAGMLVQNLNRSKQWSADPPHTKLREDRTVEFRVKAQCRN